MPKIYLLDDQDDARETLALQLKQFNKNFEIVEFSEDVPFLESVLKLQSDELVNFMAVIDVRMNITPDKWIKRHEVARITPKNRHWLLEFEVSCAHGFNIYNVIRAKHGKKVKVATVTLSTDAEVTQCREGKPLPANNQYYRHIHSISNYHELAHQLNNFFNS